MKIQELAIIFIIIILPISILLSEYTQFQIKTINLQTEYDARLTDATYDAIKAFQLNTKNSTTSDIANSKIRDIEASVNSFRNSIMAGFKLNGYTEDDLNNYIPALLYTLYDGFYIYSPYKNIVDEEGLMLLEHEQESLYGLKPYISYSCRYKKGTTDVVITYSLDNYVTVQGKIGNEYVNKSGYLIDRINVSGDTVTYNDVTIQTEQLKENLGGELCNYAKINGTKYYLLDNYIVYNSNGSLQVQFEEGNPQFTSWKNLILNNDSAKQYYKDAYEFTDWFKNEPNLRTLRYSDAIDEVIAEDGSTSITKVWADNNTIIFDFNTGGDARNNIENELSNFNQHRLAVIRHKIETNLAIAISNYNSYSGATTNVFQMPKLKENEWDSLMNNISLISFLQGLPIGGKIYNGYSLVTNSESTEVVLEENIYILGQDDTQKSYRKIGDKGFETNGTVTVNAGDYGETHSAGRLNLDFKSSTLINTENTLSYYYYPLEEYNASYDSVVMQNNVTVYDDIYAYVNAQNTLFKEAFYTALGRERYSAYKVENLINEYYSVLVLGTASGSNYESKISEIASKLKEIPGVKTHYMFTNNTEQLKNYAITEKDNYNLIIVDSFAWPLGIDAGTLLQISNFTNLITISNDAIGLPMMQSGISGIVTAKPNITESGKNKLGNITINSSGCTDDQAAFKFKEDVEVFYTGTYTNGITGEYDLIGSWKKENKKWIHSQVSITPENSNQMKLLKALVKYALNIS